MAFLVLPVTASQRPWAEGHELGARSALRALPGRRTFRLAISAMASFCRSLAVAASWLSCLSTVSSFATESCLPSFWNLAFSSKCKPMDCGSKAASDSACLARWRPWCDRSFRICRPATYRFRDRKPCRGPCSARSKPSRIRLAFHISRSDLYMSPMRASSAGSRFFV